MLKKLQDLLFEDDDDDFGFGKLFAEEDDDDLFGDEE